jgi:hypothetical protein
MKASGFALAALTIAFVLLLGGGAEAQKAAHDCSWAKHIERVVSEQTINVGPAGHQIMYSTRFDKFDKSALDDFVSGQAWIFNVSDGTKESGSHSGWGEWIGKSNEKLFLQYRGSHTVDGRVWTWKGSYEFAGGTGR